MKLPAQSMVHGDDSTIDVADQAIAKNDVGNLPITARAHIGQSLDPRNGCGFASRLIAQRLVRELGQLRTVLACCRHRWPRPSGSRARGSVMPVASSRDAWR